MKRALSTVLAFAVLVSFSACAQEQSGNVAPTESSANVESADQSIMEAAASGNTGADEVQAAFETKTVMLNSGYEMPINGIGTYSLLDEVCVESVSAALDCGVRLIDTAYMYYNEASVGEAVRNSASQGRKSSSPPSCIPTSLMMLKPR